MTVDRVEGDSPIFVEHPLADFPDVDRPDLLKQLNVAVLLCGGIRQHDLAILESSGIQVFSELTGPWRLVLENYLTKQRRS